MARSLLFIVIGLLLCTPGCSSRRQMRNTIEGMRSEYIILESSYLDLEHELLMQSEELDRLREEAKSAPANRQKSNSSNGQESQEDDEDEDFELNLEIPDFNTSAKTESVLQFNSANGSKSKTRTRETLTSTRRDRTGRTDIPTGHSSRRNRSNGSAPPVQIDPNKPLPSGEVKMPTLDPKLKFSSSSLKVPTDARVTHIVITPHLSAGHDFDRQPGDDGISLVVEPRNADDIYVPVAGNVTVSLLDPQRAGEAARVGLWSFSKSEIATRIRKFPGAGRGINLKLPWPKAAPKNSKLVVFVRYETSDGKRLEQSSGIRVSTLHPHELGWTQRTGNRMAPSTSPQERLANQPSLGSGESATKTDLSNGPTSTATRPGWRPFR